MVEKEIIPLVAEIVCEMHIKKREREYGECLIERDSIGVKWTHKRPIISLVPIQHKKDQKHL